MPSATIFLRRFTGTILPFEVDLDAKVANVKREIVKATFRRASIEPILKFNGHEMRNTRTMGYYNVGENSLVHMSPPRKPDDVLLDLTCSTSERTFSITVDPKISVLEFIKDIETEEKIKVSLLQYWAQIPVSEEDTSIEDLDSEGGWEAIPSSKLLPLVPLDAPISTFCFASDSEGKSMIHVHIRSCHPLPPPEFFPVTIILYDNDDPEHPEHKLPLCVRLNMTLNGFRQAVEQKYRVPITQHVLILEGKEYTQEDADMPLWELGFVPKCIIHAVPYISFDVEAPYQKIFETLMLHPLTKLSEVRTLLGTQQDNCREDQVIPLEAYDFTLDGESLLNESRTLWRLGVVSGNTIYLKPRHYSINLSSRSPTGTDFTMDVNLDDTIDQVIKRFQVVLSLESVSDPQLYYQARLLQSHQKVRDEGLVGGETLLYHLPMPLQCSTESAEQDVSEGSAEATESSEDRIEWFDINMDFD